MTQNSDGNSTWSEDVGDWRHASTSGNEALLAESMEEILNTGNVDAVEKYHAPDVDYYRSSDVPEDREGLKDDVRMFLNAFPDLEATVNEVFADDGDEHTVAIRYTVTGTHVGNFDTVPPTDSDVEAKGIGIAEFEEGEIVEFSLVFDNLGLLEDIGLIK